MLYLVIALVLAPGLMFVPGNRFGCSVTESRFRADLMDGEVQIDGCRYRVASIEFPEPTAYAQRN